MYVLLYYVLLHCSKELLYAIIFASVSVSEAYEIQVQTVSSRWMRPSSVYDDIPIPPTQHPYSRIVGLEADDHTMLWDSSSRGDPQGDYDQSDTRRETLPVNETLHRRLAAFFLRHFVDPSADQWKYNCHYFGASLADPDNADLFVPNAYVDSSAEVMRSLNILPKDATLELGQRAILGAYTTKPVPVHTVIGLGKQYDHCLQVVAWGGHLATMPLGQLYTDLEGDVEIVADYLYPGTSLSYSDYGFYA